MQKNSLQQLKHQQLMFVPLTLDAILMEKIIVQIQVVQLIMELKTLVKM